MVVLVGVHRNTFSEWLRQRCRNNEQFGAEGANLPLPTNPPGRTAFSIPLSGTHQCPSPVRAAPSPGTAPARPARSRPHARHGKRFMSNDQLRLVATVEDRFTAPDQAALGNPPSLRRHQAANGELAPFGFRAARAAGLGAADAMQGWRLWWGSSRIAPLASRAAAAPRRRTHARRPLVPGSSIESLSLDMTG